MAHYMEFFDKEYLGHWDLQGADRVVEIAGVEKRSIKSDPVSKPKAVAIITLRGIEKPFVANITNCKTIASFLGPDPTKWVGGKITIYETTTRSAKGDTVGCIRVRPTAPGKEAK